MAPSRALSSSQPFRFSSRHSSTPRKSLIHPSHHSSLPHLSRTSSRTVATSRRTTKALRPTPSASATPSSKFLKPTVPTIVFNPPPSAPSPFQTPHLFLPPSDPRRTILAQAHAHANPYLSFQSERSQLPPVIKELPQKKYHLTQEQISEIRELRSSDPFTWTRKKLAEKFGCTEFFISMCSPATRERLDWARKEQEEVKEGWGKKRREAREERAKRRVLIERDQ